MDALEAGADATGRLVVGKRPSCTVSFTVSSLPVAMSVRMALERPEATNEATENVPMIRASMRTATSQRRRLTF